MVDTQPGVRIVSFCCYLAFPVLRVMNSSKGLFQGCTSGSTPTALMSQVKRTVLDLAQMCENGVLSLLNKEKKAPSL